MLAPLVVVAVAASWLGAAASDDPPVHAASPMRMAVGSRPGRRANYDEGVLPGWLTEANMDAVLSGTAACTTLPHKACVGTKANAAACEQTCSQEPTCSVWAWSASTHHCWHRTDAVWAPQSASGVTSGCSRTRVGATCVAPSPPPPVSPNVTVTALPWKNNTGVSPHTPAVALDWWVKEDPKYGFQWGDASILVLDLQNPVLRAAATSLAPAVLRLGGSPIDSIEYAMSPSASAACARGKGTPGGSAGFTCSQTGLATYGCFTADRWRELLEFGKATGLRIVLGRTHISYRIASFRNYERAIVLSRMLRN